MDWIETVTGSKIDSFYESLRDGIVLCNLANKLKPGMITRINTRNTTLAHRVSISPTHYPSYKELTRGICIPG